MRFLARLSYSNVAATLALFFALTGSAVAGAGLLITGDNVENHSLSGADIRTRSLGPRTFSLAAKAELQGTRGPAGPTGQRGQRGGQGPAGPQGATGATGPQGISGPQGPSGPPGVGITTAVATGADVTGYQDLTPLASQALSAAGDYVVVSSLTVHNTGAANEYLNCGYRFAGAISGAAGVETTAGGTATGTSAGVVSADSPGTVEFICTGNGATTYDITNIKMRIHYLG